MEVFKIPVIWKENRTARGVRHLLPLEEILFLKIHKSTLYFHTSTSIYELHATLDDWRILLEGFGFDEPDRGVLVNVGLIHFIYDDMRQIHFHTTNTDLFCPISSANLKRFRKRYPSLPIRNKYSS